VEKKRQAVFVCAERFLFEGADTPVIAQETNEQKTMDNSNLFFGSEYDHFKLRARSIIWFNTYSHIHLYPHAHANVGHWLNPSVAGGWHDLALCA
jgi:hypothetical protein